MKKTDIAMIVLIASVSVLVSFFVAKSIFGEYYAGNATVKTIDKIDADIIEPSSEIFNKNAINPAVQININGTEDTSTNSGTE